jgi:tetratricopeptide (TPR) repeat protein
MACGHLVERLGGDTPDLALRRHFLSTKGELLIAALTDQPHLHWGKVGACCTAYLRALDQDLDALPGESVEQHAMAAFSFAAQCLSRCRESRVVMYYADEISQVVDAALGLSSRLLPAFVSRMWSRLLPGIDAALMFRQLGAAAERSLQMGKQSVEHAATGLAYIEEILVQSADRSDADLERILLTKAELLLSSGRYTEALTQVEALRSSSDTSIRNDAVAIAAQCKLKTGEPEAAAEFLAQVAPGTDQALEFWRTAWIGDDDSDWAVPADANLSSRDDQRIWRLQAVAAAEVQDMAAFLEAADRSTGLFSDALARDPQELGEPMVVLDEVFALLDDGTALLQVVVTEEGILTWVAQKQDGDKLTFIAPQRPNAARLIGAHDSWSRAYFDYLRHGTGAAKKESEGAANFAVLMDEMRRNWGDLLQGLVDDGVTQVIFVGDDLVDIPLHAIRIGSGKEHLIDRIPVSYVPSLSALRSCLDRTPVDESQRNDIALRSLIDLDLPNANALADLLASESHELVDPRTDSFWTDVAAAQALHIVARVNHTARMPFDSVLGPGSLDLSIGQVAAKLDLAQCELVLSVHGESALPSTLRAPGIDLAAVFLAAGAGSVLASTWVTNDEVVSELAQSFFRCWVKGQTPSRAFREALLKLRSERPALADFHWAGMRLVGAP